MREKNIKFFEICNYLDILESESSRLKIIKILSELINITPVEDIPKLMYILNGRVEPFYIKSDFNIGKKILIKVLSNIFKKDSEFIQNEIHKYGDLGEVYFRNQNLSPSEKSFSDIFLILKNIANTSGDKSMEIKENLLNQTLSSLSGQEGKYFIRIILSNFRLGFGYKTILSALSISPSNDKSSLKYIEEAYYKCSDLGAVAKMAISDIHSIRDLSVKVGIPIFPKLVDRAENFEEPIKRFGEVYVQPKFDGIRCQIHIDENSNVKLFSRNLNDITEMFPDFVSKFKNMNINGAIFDSEILGLDLSTNKFLAFQDTVKMKRKNNIIATDNTKIKAFIFDLIYLNKKSFLNESLSNRLLVLRNFFDNNSIDLSGIEITDTIKMNNKDKIYNYFEKCINEGLEGIVIKNPKSVYSPGTRNSDWLKLKKDSLVGVVDTIDAVIMGYYSGEGIRSKFGIGGVLLGIYDDKSMKFKTICKLGSGFSQKVLVELKKDLDLHLMNNPDKSYLYNKNIIPDYWVEPYLVVTVKFDEISKSPVHTSNFALRFPRFISFRNDKGVYDSTKIDEVKKMYEINKKI